MNRNPAIGALLDTHGGAPLGTAFAVTEKLALSDRHCVAPGSKLLESARIRFGPGEESGATVADTDEVADLALLHLDRPLAKGWEPVALGDAVEALLQKRFRVVGYPADRPFHDAPDTIDGHVVNPAAAGFEGVRLLNLFSPQVAAVEPKDPHGFSGGPVLVPVETGGELAVGLIRWAQVAPATERVKGGTVFATPIAAAAERWSEIRSLVRPLRPLATSPLPLPASNAIRSFREQYLGDDRRMVPFGGRSRELSALDRWLKDPNAPPYMLVTAPAGGGKSALLVRWQARLETPSVFVPISVRFRLSGELLVLRALTSRLPGTNHEVELPSDLDQARDAVSEQLRRPAPGAAGLVVVVDGLDETQGWEFGPGILPRTLGRGVKVILSARLTVKHHSPESWLEGLGFDHNDAMTLGVRALDEEGVEDVVRSAGRAVAALADDEAAVRLLHRHSQGDALVLSLDLRSLAGLSTEAVAAKLAQLPTRPAGLDSVFDRWWEDQRQLWAASATEAEAKVWSVLDALACARGPMTRADLLGIVAERVPIDSDDLDRALAALDRFVVREPESRSYSLSHPRLGAHRRERLREDGALGNREHAFITWGRRILHALSEGTISAPDASSYAVRHLGEHLIDADVPANLLLEFVHPAWQAAWDAIADDWHGYVNDVRRAGHAAASAASRAASADEEAPLAADAVKCAVVTAALRDVEIFITGDLARELVSNRVWSDSRALQVALGQDEWKRLRAITALAPVLGADTLAAATDAIASASVWGVEYGEALGAVAVHSAELLGADAAIALIGRQPPGVVRAIAILTLLQSRPANGSKEGLSLLVQDLVEMRARPTHRDDVVYDKIADSVSPQQLSSALSGSTRDVTDPAIEFVRVCWAGDQSYDPARRLGIGEVGRLAPWLAEDARKAALEQILRDAEQGIVRNANGRRVRSRVPPEMAEWYKAMAVLGPLGAVSHRLDAVQARRGLRAVQGLGAAALGRHLEDAAAVLIKLAERLSASARARAVKPVIVRLNDLVESGSRTTEKWNSVFSGLAHLGLGGELVAAALEAPDLALPRWAEVLQAAAPFLSGLSVDLAVSICERMSLDDRRRALGPILARLAARGPTEARDALKRARQPADNYAGLAATRLRWGASAPSSVSQPAMEETSRTPGASNPSDALDAVLTLLNPSTSHTQVLDTIYPRINQLDLEGLNTVATTLDSIAYSLASDEIFDSFACELLEGAISIRAASLGDLGFAFSRARRLGHDVNDGINVYQPLVTKVYSGLLEATPDEELGRWIEEVHANFGHPAYLQQRLELAYAAGERLATIGPGFIWDALAAWLGLDAITRAERLIDVAGYAPGVAKIAGPDATVRLAEWLDRN